MINVNKKEQENNKVSVVYDIQLDGTVVNALGMNIAHNTDGFNFQMQKKKSFGTQMNTHTLVKVSEETTKKESLSLK